MNYSPAAPIITIAKDQEELWQDSYNCTMKKLPKRVNPTCDDFWKYVGKLDWHNKSDGSIYSLSIEPDKNYKNIYEDYYRKLSATLEYHRLLPAGQEARACVISHFIALGRDVYNSALNPDAGIAYLITTNECQSFDALLPHGWRQYRV